MEYKKERNFIVGYEGGNLIGRWDILTGQFYGKRENTVKSVPFCFTLANLENDEENVLCYAVKFYRDYFASGRYCRCIYTEARGRRFEELISVGLRPRDTNDLDSNTKLTKDLVDYLKENFCGRYDNDYVKRYEFDKKYKEFLEGKPSYIKDVFRRCIDYIPFDFLKPFLNRAMNEHIEFMNLNGRDPAYTTALLTKNYYDICMPTLRRSKSSS